METKSTALPRKPRHWPISTPSVSPIHPGTRRRVLNLPSNTSRPLRHFIVFFLLLDYVYWLNGEVKKAEDLAASNSRLIEEDWFVDWLWGKLQAEFGFHPPG